MNMNFQQGAITNPDTGETRTVVVTGITSTTKANLIGYGSMAIGIAAILFGARYLIKNAFEMGSVAHELCEFKTMCDLGLVNGQNPNGLWEEKIPNL